MSYLQLSESRPRLALTVTFLAWKLFLLAITLGSAVGPDYDTSTSLFYERVYGAGAQVPVLARRLTRWDGLYFVHASRNGYVYEQEWAFGTGLTTLIETLVKLGQALGVDPESVSEPRVAIDIANLSHLVAVLALYQFALLISKDRKLAFTASALHVFSPAGLFLCAPYAESPFACLSFIGNLLFALSLRDDLAGMQRDLMQVVAGIVFGLSTTFRSNGLLSGLLFAVEAATCLLVFTRRPSLASLRRLVAPVLGGLCVAAGTVVPQYVAWKRYCSPELGANELRPWCARLMPSIYGFVQDHYWNVGFLRYWTPGQIPLFILAAPVLVVLVKSGMDVIAKPAQSFTVLQPFQTLLHTLAASQILLAVLALTSYHVQIISRISSAYPIWYLWLAGCLRDNKLQTWGRGYTVFMIMFSLLNSTLKAMAPKGGGGRGSRGSGGGRKKGGGSSGGSGSGSTPPVVIVPPPHHGGGGSDSDSPTEVTPKHDDIPNRNGDDDDDQPVSSKRPPPGTDSSYVDRVRTYRPSFIRAHKDLRMSKKCRLGDREIDDVGSMEIEGTSSALKSASWSEGVATYDSNDGTVDILQNFYFGLQNSNKLDDTGSCAVFFTNVTNSVAFVDNDRQDASCNWAMSKQCVDAMVKRALDVRTTGSVKDTCERLGKAFEDNLDRECAEFAGSNWNGLVVKSLDEALGSDKLLQKERDCWPAQNEQADLTLVASINRKVIASSPNTLDQSATLIQYGVMPILTFFYPDDGKLLSKAEAHMTCIKPVEREPEQVTAPPPAANNEPDSAGVRLGVNPWDSGFLILTFWLMVTLFGVRPRSW
ncbi:GPI mannosyltransferase 2 [Paramyrothecium foliicola]|nr:GPI mannosyltransferase 2 [Paramyrothecium foliicola]